MKNRLAAGIVFALVVAFSAIAAQTSVVDAGEPVFQGRASLTNGTSSRAQRILLDGSAAAVE